jgi:hypothetical protein
MTDNQNTTDVLNFPEAEKQGLPGNINVLTILTFIGCAIGLIFSLASPALMKFSLSMMDKANSSGAELTDKQIVDMANARQAIEVAQANMLPLTIIGIAGIIACFVGAMWMRKLKKDGYFIYVAGELLPVLGSIIFMGKYQFTDWKSYIGIIIPILFVVLYTTQRKYLTK